MPCEWCIDPDGALCYPSYGIAPHTYSDKLSFVPVILPRDQWPDNFREDPDNPGCGTYQWCPKCEDGKPPCPVSATS